MERKVGGWSSKINGNQRAIREQTETLGNCFSYRKINLKSKTRYQSKGFRCTISPSRTKGLKVLKCPKQGNHFLFYSPRMTRQEKIMKLPGDKKAFSACLSRDLFKSLLEFHSSFARNTSLEVCHIVKGLLGSFSARKSLGGNCFGQVEYPNS